MSIHVDRRTLVEHHRSSTRDRIPPAELKLLEDARLANAAYYERKWGGYGPASTFATPFNQDFPLKIDFAHRRKPYAELPWRTGEPDRSGATVEIETVRGDILPCFFDERKGWRTFTPNNHLFLVAPDTFRRWRLRSPITGC